MTVTTMGEVLRKEWGETDRLSDGIQIRGRRGQAQAEYNVAVTWTPAQTVFVPRIVQVDGRLRDRDVQSQFVDGLPKDSYMQ